jgi:hypothetical protein
VFRYDYSQLVDQYSMKVWDEFSLLTYSDAWALNSAFSNDEKSTLAQLYQTYFRDSPVIVQSGSQAIAFCRWKEIQLQKELLRKKIKGSVHVSLPDISELKDFERQSALRIPAKDHTDEWRIPVQQYQEFFKAMQDSVELEYLYNYLESSKDAAHLLDHPKMYFSEYSLEYEVFGDWNKKVNRLFFPLKYSQTIVKENEALLSELRNQKELCTKYYWIDVASRAVIGKVEPGNYHVNVYDGPRYLELIPDTNLAGVPLGMDVNNGWYNQSGHGFDARCHKNLSDYILEETVDIQPAIPLEQQKRRALVKGITYEQALAYYHWKYPIWRAKSEDDWQNFVYPSEEQFNRIQNGEQLIIPEHFLNFPSPVFRYVVTFIPEK